MMMKHIFTLGIIAMLALLATASANDTVRTPTPTPAEAIIQPVAANTDLAAIIENQAITDKTIRLNPKAVSFVLDYTNKYSKSLIHLKDREKPHLNTIDAILGQHELPLELKYLAVIESKLNPRAVSYAGAVGPWQFMPQTARHYGLKVTSARDDRRDYVKSTHAAAKYLKYLYNEFGDWLLVIAAYNGGPGYVYSAIKKSKSRNFWDLQYYLPAETRNHVKKFISTHYILEGQGSICTLTKEEATEQIGSLAGYLLNRNLTADELRNSSTTTISGKYRAVVIAKYVNMDFRNFNRYNPHFDKIMAEPENSYVLRLPENHMKTFVNNKYPILNESVQLLLSDSNTAEVAALNRKQQTTAIK